MKDYAFSYLRMSNVGRSCTYLKASSAVAACAYILCTAMYDERMGVQCDWTKKASELIASDTVLPKDCSNELSNSAKKDPGRFWNSLEAFEKNCNARTMKELVIGLPREAAERWEEMARDLAKFFTDKQYAVTWAIHDKYDENPHIHMNVSSRQISQDQWCEFKSRKEYALDEKGDRIPIIDKTTGEQKKDNRNRLLWKRINVMNNLIDKKEFADTIKKEWASIANSYLDTDKKVDFEHYKEDGYKAQLHQGNVSTEIMRRTGSSKVTDYNKQVSEYTSVFILIKQLRRNIELETVIIAQLKEQLLNIRIWIRKALNSLLGKEIADDYITDTEEIRLGKEPQTITQRAIRNNLNHSIDPYERYAENIRMGQHQNPKIKLKI